MKHASARPSGASREVECSADSTQEAASHAKYKHLHHASGAAWMKRNTNTTSLGGTLTWHNHRVAPSKESEAIVWSAFQDFGRTLAEFCSLFCCRQFLGRVPGRVLFFRSGTRGSVGSDETFLVSILCDPFPTHCLHFVAASLLCRLFLLGGQVPGRGLWVGSLVEFSEPLFQVLALPLHFNGGRAPGRVY